MVTHGETTHGSGARLSHNRQITLTVRKLVTRGEQSPNIPANVKLFSLEMRPGSLCPTSLSGVLENMHFYMFF